MAETLTVLIGKRIRSRREELSLTREQLAEHSEISVQFLAEIETGRKNLTTITLCKLVRALNISADEILFGEQGRGNQTELEAMFTSLSSQDRQHAQSILRTFIEAVRGKR